MYSSNSYVNTCFPYDNSFPDLGIQDFSSSSSRLFHIPSPYSQYEDNAIYLQQLHDVLYQTAQDLVTNENVIENIANSSKNEANMMGHLCAGQGTTTHEVDVKKRKSKKDRHSKINTAHGPRDRRMRLSLDVARKFFGLQDMLGFDKASKTVEWLLKQSKIAIKELTRGLTHMNKSSSMVSASSISDCEVMSGIKESIQQDAKTKTVVPSSRTKEKRTRRVRKPTFPLAKESRKKARERARERTREKKKQQLDDQQSVNLVSRSPFGTGKESASTSRNTIDYNTPHSLEVQEMENTREQQKPSQGTREETGDSSLFITAGSWSPSGFFNFPHGFETLHEQQFTDFSFMGYIYNS